MKWTSLLLYFLLVTFMAHAQNTYEIKGVIKDSTINLVLEKASISILKAKDSVLVEFGWSDKQGRFQLPMPGNGDFILLISYPDYVDYVDNFKTDNSNHLIDFKNINILLRSKLLSEVIIRGAKTPIRIKGDTTEFNSSAFVVQPNARVEDLLKQLPGIQVDKNGRITARGEAVNKVLLDGEEFFGDDPTLVTKNIRADMVEKIQLYDKKSDQATLTGIDDGKKTKTINIQLKENKKHGGFGKIDAGVGTDKYYQTQVLGNYFDNKQKIAAYGTFSNTDMIGLGMEDNAKYGGASGLDFGAGGEIYINTASQDELNSFDGKYQGQGFPHTSSAGFHYDSKWNENKQSINTNYKIGSITIDGKQNQQSINTLPSDVLINNTDQVFRKSLFEQKLDGVYQDKLNSTTDLKIYFDGTKKQSNTHDSFISSKVNNDRNVINDNARVVQDKNDQQVFNVSALLTKKFKKNGRSLSFFAMETVDENNGEGYLESTINFYNRKSIPDSVQQVSQRKITHFKSTILNTNLAYSDLLTKNLGFLLNYGIIFNDNNSVRETFDKDSVGMYSNLNRSFSNQYIYNQLWSNFGAIFSFHKDKSHITFGTKLTDIRFNQKDQYENGRIRRNYLNWNPQFTYLFNFSQQRSLRFNYWGTTSQPTIDQIQPVVINIDPLNLIIGNPDLKASYTNIFVLNYNSYQVESGRSVYFSSTYRIIDNPITRNVTTDDATGKSIYRYVNLQSSTASNFFVTLGVNQKIKKTDINMGLSLVGVGNTDASEINTLLNKTSSHAYSLRLNVSEYKNNKFNFSLSFGPGYSRYSSQLENLITTSDGVGFDSNTDFLVFLPWKLQLSTDANYQYQPKTQFFNESLHRLIWNASLSKTFFKQSNLKLSLKGNDLLNQNVGFNRSTTANLITQTRFDTIRQYFQLSVVWDFSKFDGSAN